MGVPIKTRPALRRRTAAVVCAFAAVLTWAAPAVAAPTPGSAGRSAQSWDRSTTAGSKPRKGVRPLVAPRRYAAFALDPARLEKVLAGAPRERSRAAGSTPLVVSVPTPDGGFARFAIAQSPIMEPGLAADHPEIRTYAGRGLDDPASTVRLDLSPLGFHASVREEDRSWFVDPRYRDQSQYVSYERDAVAADPYAPFVERGGEAAGPAIAGTAPTAGRAAGEAVRLRTYRLALLSDPTYATAAGGLTTAAKTVLMNRVNQLYESDFAIRMVLIAGNDALNLDTAALATGANGPCGAEACFTDPQLSWCDVGTLERNRIVTGLLAGARNYDIGHVLLGTNGGGVAGLGVVGASGKAQGCTGLTQPTGDRFAVDYVAHEMGHQFGGDHSFNGTQSNCSAGNRATGATTVEPGSGTTVMAYAGICGTDDTQAHSDPYFSQANITQMSAYVLGDEASLTSQQMGALTGFDGTDALRFTYGGQSSAVLTRGSTYTAAGIKAAIQGIPGWPSGATVTASSVTDTGFVVTFGGTLAGVPVGMLALTGLTGASGFIGELRAGGPTARGGTATTTANHVPAVSAPASFTIPVRTPFTLTAAGSDVDGDALTYLWEQNDPGTMTVAGGTALISDLKADGPLFRVFGTAARYSESNAALSPSPGANVATDTPSRSFPDLGQVLSGNTNAATGSCPAPSPRTDAIVDCYSEFLPTAAWVGVDGTGILHFRVTARDNNPAGGGVGTADTALTLAPGAGPFRLTSQATPQTASSAAPLTVTWDVAGTNLAPVNAADVRLTLSTDGGATFPHVLAASTPNDGSQAVDLPPTATTHGRIRIEAVGNVFFDASRADLAVTVPARLSAAAVDLDSVETGQTASVATIDNGGPGAARLDRVSLAGPDSAAVKVVDDRCSERIVPANGSCTVSLRLTPQHEGQHTATLVVPSDDPASPLSVPLTGAGTAPATPPDKPPVTPPAQPPATSPDQTPATTPAQTTTPTAPADTGTAPGGGQTGTTPPGPTVQELASALAARELGGAAVPLGTLGTVRLYGASTSSKLGRPRASRRLAVAVCIGQPCVVVSTAQLRTTDRKGRTTTRRIGLRTLRLRSGTVAGLTLRLAATDRRAIRRARAATIVVTVKVGKRSVAKRYRFTVG
ncbi:MAG: hypothetical protein JWN65_1932 [Solirubrobacterales bacterium]|nr:hypothetical protein [Solirubrobacterales bacterium]